MLVLTAQLGILAVRGGFLVQLNYADAAAAQFVELDMGGPDRVITSGPLAGFELINTSGGFFLRKGGYYLCAEPGREKLAHDRTDAQGWETFSIISRDDAAAMSRVDRSPEKELARFCQRVAALTERRQVVKLQLGCGPTPREGFLNLDIENMAPNFTVRRPDEFFMIRYADAAWGIPDNSVDYIFHEDFIEHVPQLQQIQILAEALRVLKPGGYHRVNTPNLMAAMKRHSRFERGFAGVYTGELKWGHIALFTPASLKEMAEMVGYREVIFTTKDNGVSPFAVPDFRPGADRDPITGNIYVDLQK